MKKAVSILLSLIMIMSVSVYAADSITVTQSNGNEATYYSTKTIWDVQFDSTYSVPSTGGFITKDNVNIALAADVKDFTEPGNMSNDSVTTHVGNSTLNSSTISNDAAVANADHDYFLKLETTDKSAEVSGATKYGYNYEVQMNQMPVRAKGGIVVVQNDFAVGTLPVSKGNGISVSKLQFNEGDTSSYNVKPISSVIYVGPEGEVTVTGKIVNPVSVNANEWHTATQVVNFDTKRINYYIDGSYIGYNSSEIGLLWKFTVNHGNRYTDPLVTYIDNIKMFKASTDMVAITADASAATVAEGSPVALKTINFNEAVATDVKIYSSTDGVNYSEYSDESEAVAYYKAYTTYYKAVAFDANGEMVSESDPVMLATNKLKANGAQYWGVNFEQGYDLKSGKVTLNGTNVTCPTGGTFATNAGSAGSKISIDAVSGISGNDSDRVLILDNSGATEPNTSDTNISAQINELKVEFKDKILVNEFDFAFNELPTQNFNIVSRFEGSYADTDDGRSFDKSGTIYLSTDGKLYLSDLGKSSGVDVVPNTWYHIYQIINMETQKTDTYLDGELLGSVSFTANKNWTKIRRFSATTNVLQKTVDGVRTYYANNNTLYYDNFNIYSVAASADSDLAIDSINYYIDGEAANKIAAGNLTAEVVLSNNNAANKGMQCIVAVYSAPGELERVTLTPVTFTADEVSKLLSLNIGEVSETDSVKIFFWSMGEDTLTPNGVNGVLANE